MGRAIGRTQYSNWDDLNAPGNEAALSKAVGGDIGKTLLRSIGSGLAAGVASAATYGGRVRKQLGAIATDVIASSVADTWAQWMDHNNRPVAPIPGLGGTPYATGDSSSGGQGGGGGSGGPLSPADRASLDAQVTQPVQYDENGRRIVPDEAAMLGRMGNGVYFDKTPGNTQDVTSAGNEPSAVQQPDLNVGDLTLDGRRVTGVTVTSEGTTISVESDSEKQVREQIEFLKKTQQVLPLVKQQWDNASYVSVPREQQALGLAGLTATVEVGGEKFGVDINTKDGVVISGGNKVLKIGYDTKGKISLGDSIFKVKTDLETSSVGVMGASVDSNGIIKFAPGFRTPIAGVNVGPEAGLNVLELGMRMADPVRISAERIDFAIAKKNMLDQIRDVQAQIPTHLDNLREKRQTLHDQVFWVPTTRQH